MGFDVSKIFGLAISTTGHTQVKLNSPLVSLHLRVIPLLQTLVTEGRGSLISTPSSLLNANTTFRAALKCFVLSIYEEFRVFCLIFFVLHLKNSIIDLSRKMLSNSKAFCGVIQIWPNKKIINHKIKIGFFHVIHRFAANFIDYLRESGTARQAGSISNRYSYFR